MNVEQFKADKLRRMATERYLEIVCESIRNLPTDIEAQAPDIAWQSMIDFGNCLRYAYHATDADKVWLVIQDHSPPLKAFAEQQTK